MDVKHLSKITHEDINRSKKYHHHWLRLLEQKLMMEKFPTMKVAVIQDSPILFNRQDTDIKAIRLINETSQKGIQLILFPEVHIPVYPRGLTFGTVVRKRRSSDRRQWQHYWSNIGNIPSNTTAALGEIA